MTHVQTCGAPWPTTTGEGHPWPHTRTVVSQWPTYTGLGPRAPRTHDVFTWSTFTGVGPHDPRVEVWLPSLNSSPEPSNFGGKVVRGRQSTHYRLSLGTGVRERQSFWWLSLWFITVTCISIGNLQIVSLENMFYKLLVKLLAAKVQTIMMIKYILVCLKCNTDTSASY